MNRGQKSEDRDQKTEGRKQCSAQSAAGLNTDASYETTKKGCLMSSHDFEPKIICFLCTW